MIDFTSAKICDVSINRSSQNHRIVELHFSTSDLPKEVDAELEKWLNKPDLPIVETVMMGDGLGLEIGRTFDVAEIAKVLEKFFREHDLSVIVDWSTFPKEQLPVDPKYLL